MRKKAALFLALVLMLQGTFIFATNAKQLKTSSLTETIDLVQDASNLEVLDSNSLVDCLLKLTFVFEDGSTETRYILVKGVSCSEILE